MTEPIRAASDTRWLGTITVEVEAAFDGNADHLAQDMSTLVERALEERGADVYFSSCGASELVSPVERPTVEALRAEAERLADAYGPDPDYPALTEASRRLCVLAGWDVDLLTAATPPPAEDEPEWRSLLNLARVTAISPLAAATSQIENLRRTVQEMRGQTAAMMASLRATE